MVVVVVVVAVVAFVKTDIESHLIYFLPCENCSIYPLRSNAKFVVLKLNLVERKK